MWLWTAIASAQSSLELAAGPTLLQPCLEQPLCVELFGPVLAETLIEAGYALQHEPFATSVFGSAGTGVITEVAVSSIPLGEPNALQAMYSTVPVVPRLAVGASWAGSGVAVAGGLHGLPSLGVGAGNTDAVGASASGAAVLADRVRLGGELSWTHASFAVSVLDSTADLRQIEALQPYVPRGVVCAAPCLDELRQVALSARVGAMVAPIDELFVYAKVGVTSQGQRLRFAIDGSLWELGPAMPEWIVGGGTRLGGRWQLGMGVATAYRPEAARTDRKAMTKLAISTAFRFGPR